MNKTALYKQGIESGQYPNFLYKYVKINNNLENSLRKHYLWYESLDNYNDPYEGCFETKLPSIIDYKKCVSEHKGLSKEPTKQNRYALANELQRELSRVSKEQCKVCCFSSIVDNILMWAHYAEGHSGVCLVFNYLNDVNSFSEIVPVMYTNIYPNVDYINDVHGSIQKILMTKSLDWSYEKEFRNLKICKDNEVSFKPIALTEIIFGCKVDHIKKKNIIDLVKALQEYNHVKFRQAELHPYMYKLIIK